MKELSLNAQNCIETYMQKVRSRLHGAKTLDANDIERDITEHIERELESEAEPVGSDAVECVLDRLGAPEQWVPDEELSWWRKIMARMQNGPDDWRLAYICFGLFAVGFVALPFWFIFFLPLSAYIARSAISVAGGTEDLGAQKKLLYPPLIVFYWIAGLAFFFVPIVPLVILADVSGYLQHDVYRIAFAWGVIISITGLWWSIVSGFVLRKQLLEKIIFPFGGQSVKKKVKRVLISGVILMVVGLAISVPIILMSI